MAGPELRVVVCDDSSLVRQQLVRMVNREPGFKAVGEAGDGHDCLQKILDHKPDLVLVDLDMPNFDGIKCIQEARRMGLTTPFVVVAETHPDSETRTQAALAAGAEGFVVRPHSVLQVEQIQPELSKRLRMFATHHPVVPGSAGQDVRARS